MKNDIPPIARGIKLVTTAALVVGSMACTYATRTRTDTPDRVRAEVAAHPNGEVAKVYRLWNTYLESRTISYGCSPSPHWVASEQGNVTLSNGMNIGRCYDLVTSIGSPNIQHNVVSMEPVDGGRKYRITATFTNLAAVSKPRTTTVTVYAVAEGNSWKLSSALGENTKHWKRQTVGPITYIIAPGRTFSRAKAEQAVAFADSLSKAFDVPTLHRIDYYLVGSGDEMMRMYGLEMDTTYGKPGGQSMPGMIVSGDPVFAEKHGHELVHTVLFPFYYGKHMHVAASEGVPTWLGGTVSMHYADALRALRKHIEAHPALTLDSLLASNGNTMHNPAAALLTAMVYERGGVNGIQRYLDTGGTYAEFKVGVERIVGMSWVDIAADWKRRALASN